MNKFCPIELLLTRLFDFNISRQVETAIEIYRFQYENNALYQQYCNSIGRRPSEVNRITDIPFLPISFFKTHTVTSTFFNAEIIFESSGTTKTVNSKHYVKDLNLYIKSFTKGFEIFYGQPEDYCIIGLLPSYLERQNSSLVLMVNQLIKESGHPKSGFYLHDHEALAHTLQQLEQQKQKTLLIGVTFALLDFAATYPMPLKHTLIMETGGMKGRKEEMIRADVHAQLQKAFGLETIHSEYGMTELLSQAYSNAVGIFQTPPWMRIMLRSEDDPFELIDHTEITKPASGVINVMDLANIYSCSFIATDDAGKLYPGGSFEVLGRTDNSDIRGCSLLAL